MSNTEMKENLHTPIFEVDKLSYTFPGAKRPALDNVSFAVRPGEILGIAGDSGSGKTTLLNALSGIIPHFFHDGLYEGQVTFEGNVVGNTSIYQLMERIGLVFQDPGTQSFGMEVDNAIAFGMENLAVPPDTIRERIGEVENRLHISHLSGRNMQELSGGELQATAIATVLAMNPEVIMLDEVISALDVGGQERIRRIVEELKRQGKTMIIVDSDLRWLGKIADRLLLLDKGKLAYDGSPQPVFEDPNLAEIAGLESQEEVEFREASCGEAIVSLKGVSFAYDNGTMALEGINLDVKEGSCTAFVGHNGSGKSTMAKLIGGLLKPSTGEVLTCGKKPFTLPSRDLVKDVGYVFQNPAQMFVSETVGKELAFTPKILGREPATSLDSFGLEEYQDASPWDLSSGQQQRLAIASVVAANPRVMIFDEPTLGQTRQSREALVERIKQLQESGTTVILISHDLNFVRKAATDVHVLNKGHLVRSGSAQEILSDGEFFRQLELPLPW